MKVTMVYGLPGSGKSYFAIRLAEKTGSIYLSSDRIRKSLFSEKSYSEKDKQEVYDMMLQKMELALKEGQHVILDATFYKKNLRNIFRETAKKNKADLYCIEVSANEDIIRKRVSEKREDSDADWMIYEKLRNTFEQDNEPHLILESKNNNIESMLSKALEYINDK